MPGLMYLLPSSVTMRLPKRSAIWSTSAGCLGLSFFGAPVDLELLSVWMTRSRRRRRSCRLPSVCFCGLRGARPGGGNVQSTFAFSQLEHGSRFEQRILRRLQVMQERGFRPWKAKPTCDFMLADGGVDGSILFRSGKSLRGWPLLITNPSPPFSMTGLGSWAVVGVSC
jgi:hypothetical protein